MAQLATLARAWYAGRLEDDYVPPTREQRQAQLAAHGFTGEFWELG